jgi:adenine specific DNA methylase Mod
MDGIFGAVNYRSEIAWKRSTAHGDARGYGNNTDTILFYRKSEKFAFNTVYQACTEEYKSRFKNKDSDGRLWADDNLTAKGLSGGGY